MDTLTPAQRSRLMSHVRSTDTSVELRVRRLVHEMGFRYRLHQANLPGKPDLVFASRRAVIFVHGCFWHRHQNCRYATTPKTRVAFWKAKFKRNVERDAETLNALNKLGWRALVIWQCELSDCPILKMKIRKFLDVESLRND